MDPLSIRIVIWNLDPIKQIMFRYLIIQFSKIYQKFEPWTQITRISILPQLLLIEFVDKGKDSILLRKKVLVRNMQQIRGTP